MLQLGSSKPWPLVMEEMTGNPKLTADALVEYFGPLLKFLRDDVSFFIKIIPHSTFVIQIVYIIVIYNTFNYIIYSF